MIEHSAHPQGMPAQAAQPTPRARRAVRDPEVLNTLNRERIRAMMEASRPVTPQDPAGLYLQAYGMDAKRIKTMGHVLRYAPAETYWGRGSEAPTSTHPALLAVLSNKDTTTPELPPQLLRVYLTERGTLAPVATPIKRSGCHMPNPGTAIRLGAPALIDGARRLGVAVGLPQALQASRCTGLPVWAVLDMESISALHFPRKTPLDHLHIFTYAPGCFQVKELARKAQAFGIKAIVCPQPSPQNINTESTATP